MRKFYGDSIKQRRKRNEVSFLWATNIYKAAKIYDNRRLENTRMV